MNKEINNVFKTKPVEKPIDIERHKNICRVDQESRKQFGWFIRVRKEGKFHSNFCADKASGGYYSSLLEAISWRDNKERELGLPRTDRMIVGVAKSNTGIVGLTFIEETQTYQITWVTPQGKLQASRRALSIGENKEDVIKELLAIRATKEAERLVGDTVVLNEVTKEDFVGGPYRSRAKIGSILKCKVQGEVKVNRISGALIPWPMAHSGLVLYGGLVKAVKTESVASICHWFGVKDRTVSKWRSTLGVGRFTKGTKKLVRKYNG